MEKQIAFYKSKLEFEMDSSDLFQALEKNEKIVVLDTRKKNAFENEHIPTAVNLPHNEMNAESIMNFNKDKLYVCYCDGIGCNASTKGALNMAKLGFKVKELIGGIEWWKLDGYETEGNKPSKGEKISCAC